jgi:acetyl/propionyl-CoA carboxylase alpha subunit
MALFRRILVANRGEIALRVIRTAQEMGIETVAVYSDADRNALHVRKASHAVHLGGSKPSESYLDIGKVLDAAQRLGADAIHPG